MQYIELKNKLSEYLVFSLQDIKKLDERFYSSRLVDWQKKGYIKKIRRGYYIFADQPLNESILFYIANNIYSPSYISFEMALSYYHLIPESVYGLTSATTNKVKRFKTDLGVFIYSHLRPELMFGYELLSLGGVTFKVAEIEKALLDFFYINKHLKTEADFFELRINEDELKIKLDYEKLMRYLQSFHNSILERRIKKFLKYIKYAEH